MDTANLRSIIVWSKYYCPEWDHAPDEYIEHEQVGWGRSRRLGLYRQGRVKAYLGVQHIDPDKPGWGFVQEAECRFFLSLFVGGECLTLRTFPLMDDVLEYLQQFLIVATR